MKPIKQEQTPESKNAPSGVHPVNAPISKSELASATLTLQDWLGGPMVVNLDPMYDDDFAAMSEQQQLAHYEAHAPHRLVSEAEARDWAVKRVRGEQALADRWERWRAEQAA